MQGFAQVLADSIGARIQSGQNIYDQAAVGESAAVDNSLCLDTHTLK